MKRLLKHTILFALVAIVAYPVLLCLLGDLGWVRTARTEMANRGFLNSRIKDIRNYHNVDVLFLGSSHCYRTFDTRFYRSHGISCFNLGSSNPYRPTCYSRPISTASTPALWSSKSTPTS